MENFLGGRGLEPHMQLFFAKKTFSDNLSTWWRELHKGYIMRGKEQCRTWNDMKAVLRCRIAPPLVSKKKVATAHGQNPQGSKKNVR
jgi:hypothetical protein